MAYLLNAIDTGKLIFQMQLAVKLHWKSGMFHNYSENKNKFGVAPAIADTLDC